MEKQKEYKHALLDIAKEVYDCVFGANDNALLQQLQDTLKNFAKQENKHRKYQKEQYDKAIKEGKSYTVSNNTQIPDKYKTPVLWFSVVNKITPPVQPARAIPGSKDKDGKPIISRPIDAHHQIEKVPCEINRAEREQRNLVGLACIYDNCRVKIGKEDIINDSIVPEDVYNAVWKYISVDWYSYEGKSEFWKTALTSIHQKQKRPTNGKPEDKEQPAPETEQKTPPAKRGWIKRVIGWIFKKTSHLIVTIIVGIIVAIVAAIVVDILADFGRLQSIKDFVSNMLRLK